MSSNSGRRQETNEAQAMQDLVQVRLGRLIEIVAQLAKLSVEPRGLRTTDLRILNILYDTDNVSINELARRSHVDKAWISRSVGQLLEKKWISKRADPNDSRAQLVSLTAKSRRLLDQVRPQVQINEKALLQGINEKTFKKSLDTLLVNAERLLEQRNEELKPGSMTRSPGRSAGKGKTGSRATSGTGKAATKKKKNKPD